MTKLGDDLVVLEITVDDWEHRDDYGNPTKTKTYRPIRWCNLTPARASEDQSRTGPAIVGANLLAPRVSVLDGTRYDNYVGIQAADAILSDPVGPDSQGRYTGRRWEILGELGKWAECCEAQLRRLL